MKKQESPAVADKPAQRESMPKIAPIYRTVFRQISNRRCIASCG